MKKIIVCLFFFIICLGSFSQKKTVEVLDGRKIDCTSQALNYNVSDMVEKCVYVPLDRKAVFSMGQFFKFEVEGDYVLIQGARRLRNELPCILLFSKDGKFLAEIGRMGGETEEYMEITAVAIDTLKKMVLVVDRRSKRNLWYDFSGKFLRATPAYRTAALLGKLYFNGEDLLVGYQNISIGKEMAYFSTDRNSSRLDTLGKHRIAWKPGVISYGCHPLSRYGKRCLMVYPFCDTIYEYNGREVYPRYITAVKTSLPAGYKIPADADYLDLLKEMREKGYIQKADLFETQKYLWIVYDGGDRMIYDKTTGKGFFNKRKFQDHPTVITPLDFMGQSGEALVSMLSAEELIQMKEDYAKRGVQLQGDLKTLLENIKKEDNPVMVYYYFK